MRPLKFRELQICVISYFEREKPEHLLQETFIDNNAFSNSKALKNEIIASALDHPRFKLPVDGGKK